MEEESPPNTHTYIYRERERELPAQARAPGLSCPPLACQTSPHPHPLLSLFFHASMFCQATGFGGTVQQGAAVEDKLRARKARAAAAAASGGGGSDAAARAPAAPAPRAFSVTFNADTASGLPWRFAPAQRSIRVVPGQAALAFFTATNTAPHAVTGVSTYNVAPAAAGPHFNKVQCFCFEEQRLGPGERVDMPVLFYLDEEAAADPRLAGVDSLTLSYTFFVVAEGEEGEEGRRAVEAAAVAGMTG